MPDTYLCPFCDQEVAVGHNCPTCTKNPMDEAEPKSWEQEEAYDGLDLPDDEPLDYDAFLAREFDHRPHKQLGIALHWWITGVILLVALILLWVVPF